MPRELTSHKVNGCNEALAVYVMDEPGHGGACHVYNVTRDMGTPQEHQTVISFQNGPIKVFGTNGLTHEVLLAIIEDRLLGFQSGPYACDENAEAQKHIQAAQNILKSRTEARLARGVEGTHKV